ncbi:MAG: hypothetical protein KDA62_15965 [Planctomycetales bacterium]|nr:hypothetical protein [Planctomycetales bacterium]
MLTGHALRLLHVATQAFQLGRSNRDDFPPRRWLVGPRNPNLAAWLLVFVGAIVVIIAAPDYGVAWDDSVQTRFGALVLDYFLSAGQNRACNELLDLRLYGPPVELLAAAAARYAPDRLIETRHLLCGLLALLSVPALFRWGRLLGQPWLGVFSAVVLLLSPRFFGHAFLNSKDMPFAVGMTASLAALTALLARRRYHWREFIECGLLLGCTTAVRPGGWMLLGPLYLAGAFMADWQTRQRRSRRRARRTLLKQATMFGLAWLVMIACWPWAHESPLANPLQAIRMASKFHIVVPVLFEGRIVPSDSLPRYYLAKYLWITTPPWQLLLAAVGCVTVVARCWQSRTNGCRNPRRLVDGMLIVWLTLPLLLFALLRPNAYDGIRHFLFVLPALALMASVGLQSVFLVMKQLRGGKLAGRIASVGVAAAIAWQVAVLATLHPYQLAYFNGFVGGVAGASRRYETEYWMTSYGEAMRWINSQPRNANGQPTRMLVAANENSLWCASYFAGPRLELTTTLQGDQPGDLPSAFDFYLGTTRTLMADNFPDAEICFRVNRAGANFAVVKRRKFVK